ncbi:MAG: hypothetical protein VX598_05750 [Verrucomicrobiota bacterium]|nr:hypothetical protein [Verrucomicrobiota bacterium]
MDKCIELLDKLKDKPLGMEIGELKTDTTWDAGGNTKCSSDDQAAEPKRAPVNNLACASAIAWHSLFVDARCVSSTA